MNSHSYEQLRKEWLDQKEVLSSLETPKLVYSTDIVGRNISLFKEALNYDVEPYYSVKANNNKKILEYISNKRLGFEVASSLEIEQLRSLGVAPERIIYGAPVKITEHVKKAFDFGIKTYAVDSSRELEKISSVAPLSRVYIRVDTSNEGATWSLNEKFGIPSAEVLNLAKEALTLRLVPVGLTFAMGWNNSNTSLWGENLKKMAQLTMLMLENNIKIEFVDLGGGFPSHLVNKRQVIEEIGSAIAPVINQLKSVYNIKTIAEPGSFLVSDSGIMLTSVIEKRKKNDKWWLFLDTGIIQGFPWILSDLQYAIVALEDSDNKHLKPYVVTGPTCDSHDIFNSACMLPDDIEVGDKLVIFPAGGYIESSTAYSGFTLPQNYFIPEQDPNTSC